MTHNQRELLKPGNYRVVIKSKLEPGVLNYAELLINGRKKEEIFFSTYVCHPSMANNEVSGPVVTSALCQWLLKQTDLEYSYRIIFIPETIGSITYLSRNLHHMKNRVIAGFNISCVGDEGCYSYVSSRHGNTLSDITAKHVFKNIDPNYIKYSWLKRGSDERQYCAPGVDLPVVSISRSKYGEYPEYHTSMDNLDFISSSGLAGSYSALLKIIHIIEKNKKYKVKILCEPQMGKRDLYPSLSQKGSSSITKPMMNILSYCDGKNSLLEIADIISLPFWEVTKISSMLNKNELIEEV